MSPANGISGVDRGYIIPIGGAEEKLHNPEILARAGNVATYTIRYYPARNGGM